MICSCPYCDSKGPVPDTFQNRTVKCPKCGGTFVVGGRRRKSIGELASEALDRQSLPADDAWYYQELGREFGPVSMAELRRLAGQGDVGPETFVRRVREGRWVSACKVRGLLPETEQPLWHELDGSVGAVPEKTPATPTKPAPADPAPHPFPILSAVLVVVVGVAIIVPVTVLFWEPRQRQEPVLAPSTTEPVAYTPPEKNEERVQAAIQALELEAKRSEKIRQIARAAAKRRDRFLHEMFDDEQRLRMLQDQFYGRMSPIPVYFSHEEELYRQYLAQYQREYANSDLETLDRLLETERGAR